MEHRSNSLKRNTSNPVCVEMRVMFLQIGSIDTQLAQFNAHVAIEARWLANNSILSTLDDDARQSLYQGQIIHLPNDFKEHKENWHPKLFLLNSSISNYEEKLRYTLKKDEDNKASSHIYVREHRIVKASFCIRFHLRHYPSDVQTLSISIGSALCDDEVKLVQHPTILSGINKEVFESQQEWELFEHVETIPRKVAGYFSLIDEDRDLDKPGDEKERSVLTFSCHVARQTGYFIWNDYCIVFLLTIMAFSSFAVSADQTQQRLMVVYTFLLGHVAFRWTIRASHTLPPVSYLTTMDKYSVLSVIAVAILGAWHAIISSLIFDYDYGQSLTPHTSWVWIDRYMCLALGSLYIIMHLVFIICHYRGPFRHRQDIKRKDVKYRRQILGLDKLINKTSNEV